MGVPLHQTKHFRVAQKLRQMIVQMPVGEKVPTQTQMMQQFQSSQSTVERALTKLRDEGLIGRIPGRKRLVRIDRPDPGIRQIAIIRPDWVSEVYEGIGQSLANAGKEQKWTFDYVTYTSMCDLDLDRLAGAADGIALMTTCEPFPASLVQSILKPSRPIVLVQDELQSGEPAWSVMSDDGRISAIAVEHLYELGHRRIAMLLPTLVTAPMRAALAGYQKAMAQYGLNVDEQLIMFFETKPGTYPQNVAYDFLCDYFDKHVGPGKARRGKQPFTAIICPIIQIAMAVMRILRERGLRVPDDVSVCAADGLSEMGPFFTPPLTTMRTDINEYGRAIIDLLEAQFAGADTPQQILLQPTLYPSESSAVLK